jgi:heme A synthase
VITAAVSTGDLLSAESLLLAIVSGLLVLWYGEIQSALHLEKRLRVEDRGPEVATLTRTLWRRAMPLTLLAAAATAVFAPNSAQLLRRVGPLFHGDMPPYDPIAVSVVGVNVGMALVALYSAALAAALARRRRSFRRP